MNCVSAFLLPLNHVVNLLSSFPLTLLPHESHSKKSEWWRYMERQRKGKGDPIDIVVVVVVVVVVNDDGKSMLSLYFHSIKQLAGKIQALYELRNGGNITSLFSFKNYKCSSPLLHYGCFISSDTSYLLHTSTTQTIFYSQS